MIPKPDASDKAGLVVGWPGMLPMMSNADRQSKVFVTDTRVTLLTSSAFEGRYRCCLRRAQEKAVMLQSSFRNAIRQSQIPRAFAFREVLQAADPEGWVTGRQATPERLRPLGLSKPRGVKGHKSCSRRRALVQSPISLNHLH